jgi:two-component system phosphate regulon response regulator OmpR
MKRMNLARTSLLIVDDDPSVRAMLQEYLSDHGYAVRAVGDGPAMRAEIERELPDLVLLDLRLPGEDGLTLARHLREKVDVGIVMVTASGDIVDRVVGLEMGADDYISKPFDPRELLARIKSVLRRYQRAATAVAPAPAAAPANQRVTVGACTLDLEARQLRGANGDDIPLTSAEFDLLKIFAERPNRPLTRDQILNLTQNRDWDPFDRSIDIRIARLRRKVEPDADKPQIIKTVRGVGYMYVPRGR